MSTAMKVTDIMTKNPVVVHPDTPLFEAAGVIAEHHFDGVPVVDGDGVLAGILTEYDLVSKGSMVHLPTLQIVLQNLTAFRRDRSQFQKEVREVSALKVRDVMNADPLTLPDTAHFEDVETAFREHHRVNPIPVINSMRKVVGVISRFDLLKPLHMLHGKL